MANLNPQRRFYIIRGEQVAQIIFSKNANATMKKVIELDSSSRASQDCGSSSKYIPKRKRRKKEYIR